MDRREVFFLAVGLVMGAMMARFVFRGRAAGAGSDTVIAGRVRDRLRRLGVDVEVVVSRGDVELRGSVARSDHARILRAVARVRGVHSIDDDLALLEVTRTSILH
jgi:osmotically-inducible protein OsmY